jgi:hypothetical protein
MRFLLAALLFILAISLLLLGLAQRTIWAPPDSFSVNLSVSGNEPYLVIPAEELALMPGDPVIGGIGDGEVFVAYGQEADVLAWVGQALHSEAVTSDDGTAMGVRDIAGTTDLANPSGSDLWINQSLGEGYAELAIPAGGDNAVIVASDGFEPAPTRVRVAWPIENSTVVSDVFLGVGFGFLLAAILLNLLALRKMLINRGPRRKLPKAPQGPKYRPRKSNFDVPKRGRRAARSKIAMVPIGIALTFALTGCSVTQPL